MEGWYFPNLALLLNGEDPQNLYGGEYERIIDGNFVQFEDDDFLEVTVDLENNTPLDSTVGWHSLGKTGDRDVVHSAGSSEVVATPDANSQIGSGSVRGIYADGNRNIFNFEFDYDLSGPVPSITIK